jgi:hypothetical protein
MYTYSQMLQHCSLYTVNENVVLIPKHPFFTLQLFDRMCMALGGRVAEGKIFQKITTGTVCQAFF